MRSLSVLRGIRSLPIKTFSRPRTKHISSPMHFHHLFPLCGATATFAMRADIRADTNRDGIIDMVGDSDCVKKINWTKAHGAYFLANIGDTDRRCSKNASSVSDELLGACHDASDDLQRAPQYLAPLRTVPIKDISDSATGWITVPDPKQKPFVRIFRQQDGKWTILKDNDVLLAVVLKEGLVLGVDARDTRRPDVWDGRVVVRFSVQDGKETSTDEVELRVAPILVHNHLDKVKHILSVAGDKIRMPWQDTFAANLTSAATTLKLPKPFLFENDDDPWAQDFVEPGYTNIPGPDGPLGLHVHIRSSQDSRVSGRQVFERLRDTGVAAVQHLGGARDEINSMGNLECTPPFVYKGQKWPAGRIIMGQHGPYEPHILPYLRAQEVQEPILLDSAWLWVGHVDEFVQFLPAKTDRGWVIVVADPNAGLKLLKDVESSGHGEVPMYSRKNSPQVNGVTLENCTSLTYGCVSIPVPNKTISEFLSDPDIATTNIEAAKRIEGNIDLLKAEIGITVNEIYRLPTVFKNTKREDLPYIGPRAADEKLACVAVYPATINGLVLTGFGSYLAPNPWGPIIDGKDILADSTRKLYEGLGWNVKFLDNWNSHHNYGGEVHCGTNTVREIGRRWW